MNYFRPSLSYIELHPGEKERPLNRLKPRRLGVWGLFFALLLGGKALWAVPHLMAQPAHPGAIVSGSGSAGLVSEPIEEPAQLGGDRIGKSKVPVQPAEEGYGVVYRPVEGAESAARDDRLRDEAPSVWREEAEYDDSALGPEHEGLVEEEEAEYGMFEEGDDSAEEWIDEGGEPGDAYADGAVVAPFEAPRDVGRVEEEKNKGVVVGMRKGLAAGVDRAGKLYTQRSEAVGINPNQVIRRPDISVLSGARMWVKRMPCGGRMGVRYAQPAKRHVHASAKTTMIVFRICLLLLSRVRVSRRRP